ncbi:MAG: hypothetical protein ACRDOG_00780 [Gaiellaceae bacterium]
MPKMVDRGGCVATKGWFGKSPKISAPLKVRTVASSDGSDQFVLGTAWYSSQVMSSWNVQSCGSIGWRGGACPTG